MKKFHIKDSDITDSEHIQLCKMIVEKQYCYATYRNNDGIISIPFRVRLQPDAKL